MQSVLKMLYMLYPSEYADSVFSLDYEKLWQQGYRGLIFDIDNTLVHHGEDSTEEIDELFREIHRIGFKTVLLSDNTKERILRFMRNIDSLYIDDAQKPAAAGYLKAVEMMGIDKKEALFIGDQVFRDIYGANRCGIDSVLVRYLRYDDEKKIGIRRRLEKIVLWFYRHNRSARHRLGDVLKKEAAPMPAKQRRLFCEMNPLFFKISTEKEILKRNIRDMRSGTVFAAGFNRQPLPNVVSSHRSDMIKRGPGIDPVLQTNKVKNIRLACRKMNGLIIHPGEEFSFWRLVGRVSKRNGYLDGRVIYKNRLIPGVGGGLCNLANTIHLLVLHSPLDVTEFHSHSDALAPDKGKRVPFSSGTSVSYNYIDYRFRNSTDQDIQLLLWCKGDELRAQLRSEAPFPWKFRLEEEDHHFAREGDKYYRISRIYKVKTDRATGKQLEKQLVLDNHSEVMFDPALIPPELIRE